MKWVMRYVVMMMACAYLIYTDQMAMFTSIIIAYILGLLYVRYILNTRTNVVYSLFDLFFVVYGFLTLFTHIELIYNPLEDYFIHNDSAHSFYKAIMSYTIDCKWSELLDATLYNPLFLDEYPLAALLFTVIAKIGVLFGVVNLRLFLRIHIFLLGACIVATMATILSKYGIDSRSVKRFIVPFGLFSYLYLTSAIFTRDIHICFVYTLVSYCFLVNSCRYKLLKFIILFFLALGFRPENGVVVLPFILGYYWEPIRRRLGPIAMFCFCILSVSVMFAFSGLISMVQTTLTSFNLKALTNTGGLFEQFYTLPFPLNTAVMVVYMLIMPMPIHFYLPPHIGCSWLNLPFCLSPYLMWAMCYGVFYYFRHKQIRVKKITIYIFLMVLSFIAIVYSSPDLRRAFACIPGIYVFYCMVRKLIPNSKFKNAMIYGWITIALINVVFFIYTL